MPREDKVLPVCQKCKFYKLTWQIQQPHSCLFFGFKSYALPSQEVFNSTGFACPQFRLSEPHRKNQPKFPLDIEEGGILG